jgi:hypothetical protein
VSHPVRVPVRGAVSRATPKGRRRGAPEPLWLEVYFLVPRSWLVPEAGRGPRIGSRLPSIGSLRLEHALEPRAEVTDVFELGLIPWPEGAHGHTQGEHARH